MMSLKAPLLRVKLVLASGNVPKPTAGSGLKRDECSMSRESARASRQ